MSAAAPEVDAPAPDDSVYPIEVYPIEEYRAPEDAAMELLSAIENDRRTREVVSEAFQSEGLTVPENFTDDSAAAADSSNSSSDDREKR